MEKENNANNTSTLKEENTRTPENNLERFLNDVFQKECVFRISEDEVGFIQAGIECLVEQIVELVQEDLRRDMENKKLSPSHVPLLDKAFILKAGSFYEGTKNRFPDEFDFLFCFYKTLGCVNFPYFLPSIESYVRSVCMRNRKTFKYKNSFMADRRQIWLNKFKEEHGPASWLVFTYKDQLGKNHEINVDLVPACKVYLDPDTNKKDVEDICELKPFLKEIWSTKSILVVKNNFSFTETEVSFMKMTLSENHRQVYRIIKFLINGHGDEKYISGFMNVYSSYKIKTIIISHHYKCRNTDTSGIGNCVLDVLADIAAHESGFPTLVTPEKLMDISPGQTFRVELKALASRLRSMQNQTGYEYSRDRKEKSVTKQYCDEHRNEDWSFFSRTDRILLCMIGFCLCIFLRGETDFTD